MWYCSGLGTFVIGCGLTGDLEQSFVAVTALW